MANLRAAFTSLHIVIVVALITGALLYAAPPANAQADETLVQVVQGLGGVGPVDVYIDGGLALIGLDAGQTSGQLRLASGEHQFAVVATGASPDTALVSGPITLRAGRSVYATLVGTADAPSVGLFVVDDRPLDPGRSRFRIVNGSLDTSLVPVFAGGDALTEPLQFGDASEYSQIDAGVYDLDFLDETSGTVLLSLPGAEFAEGTVNDILITGQAADATLATIVETTPVEITLPTGRNGQLAEGACNDLGDAVADLGLILPGPGETVGVSGGVLTAQAYASANVPFATLTDTAHAVVIRNEDGGIDACGAIGGALTDTGSLVVALEGDGAVHGVAVLAPGLDAPDSTGVSLFLADLAAPANLPAAPAATPTVGG
ncbi:MAG: DUF4397 domain-containing protein [Thermomicrobiales bacterium]